MVIPWAGIQLSHVLSAVRPSKGAKYVAFETLFDPERMPGQKTNVLEWPYVEGLRLDEAMHPLAILALGLYGRELPPQDGAPLRLVIPWKYGFKGIKSIVKITLTDKEPTDQLESLRSARVWLSGQRQSAGAAPTLESSNRAANRRVRSSTNAHV